MRGFRIVFAFELRTHLSKKAVRVTAIVLVTALFLAAASPRILDAFQAESGGRSDGEHSALPQDTGYVFQVAEPEGLLRSVLGIREAFVYSSREGLEKALKDRSISVGFIIHSPSSFEALYLDRPPYATEDAIMEALMTELLRDRLLAEAGVAPKDFAVLSKVHVDRQVTVLGRDSASSLLMSMLLLFVLYFMVLLYGNTTASIIAREKDSRTMEVLITSASPRTLILGKVAASGAAAFVQAALLGIAALAGFVFAKDYYPDALRTAAATTLSPGTLAVYLFYSLSGFILYLFLYASLGSTVSRVEDVASATATIQVLLIGGYLISSTLSMNPGNLVAVVGSVFPFTSMMVMPMRYTLSSVPTAELFVSAALLALCVWLFAWLSIRIYRWGTLNYGNKKGLVAALRHLRRGN